MAIVYSNFNSYSISDVESMLIAYESRIEKHRQQEIASINLSESAKSNDTPTQSQMNVT